MPCTRPAPCTRLPRALAAAITLTPASAHAQPADDTTRELARYVDESALAVLRVDARALDVVPLLAQLRRADPDAAPPDAEASFAAWRDGFLGAGGTEFAIVVTLKALDEEPMFMIAPLADPARGDELAAFITRFGPDHAEVRGGMVVAGTPALFAGLPLDQPTRLDEIARAQALAGPAPVRVLLIPSDFARRALEELVPTLPPVVGSIPISTLTNGVRSAAIAANPGHDPALRVVIQSRDSDAAQALVPALKSMLRAGANAAPAPMRDALSIIAPTLEPAAQADRVVCELDSKAVDAAARALGPSLASARTHAKAQVVMSQIRGAAMGCMVYAADHQDAFPASLAELSKLGYFDESISLARSGKPFTYLRPPGGTFASVADPSKAVLIHEPLDPWLGSVAVGFVDGHVEFIVDRAAAERLIAATTK